MNPDTKNPEMLRFWSDMSLELFRNVRGLYEQIDTQFASRTGDEGVGAQMSSFCVYSCGLFASYLYRYPNSELPILCCSFRPAPNSLEVFIPREKKKLTR